MGGCLHFIMLFAGLDPLISCKAFYGLVLPGRANHAIFRYAMMTWSQRPSAKVFLLWPRYLPRSSNCPSSVKHFLGWNFSPLFCSHVDLVNVFIVIQIHKQQTEMNYNVSLTGLRTLKEKYSSTYIFSNQCESIN